MFASPPDDAAWLTRIGCGRFSENFCGSLWESGPGWAGVKVVHVARWSSLFQPCSGQMFGTLLSRKELLYHALLVLCPF
jgi:hypothetical protein